MNFLVRAYYRKSKGRCSLPFSRSRFCLSSLYFVRSQQKKVSSFSSPSPLFLTSPPKELDVRRVRQRVVERFIFFSVPGIIWWCFGSFYDSSSHSLRLSVFSRDPITRKYAHSSMYALYLHPFHENRVAKINVSD